MVMRLYQVTAEITFFWLTIAIFESDTTLSLSSSFCIGIGEIHAGTLSGNSLTAPDKEDWLAVIRRK